MTTTTSAPARSTGQTTQGFTTREPAHQRQGIPAQKNQRTTEEATPWPTSTSTVKLKPRARMAERAINALQFPVDVSRVVSSHPTIAELCHRAAFYEQAVRVTIQSGSGSSTWWLQSADSKRLTVQHRHPSTSAAATLTIEYDSCSQATYEPSKATFECQVLLRNRVCATIDYDFYLADQTHRHNHPLDFNDFAQSTAQKHQSCVNWNLWIDKPGNARRVVGPQSTSSISFERNLHALRTALEVTDAITNGQSLAHLTYTNSGLLYKFLEHAVLRARSGDIPPSQVERLCALKFVWGTLQRTPAQLLLQPPGDCYKGSHNTRPTKGAIFPWPLPDFAQCDSISLAQHLNTALKVRMDAGCAPCIVADTGCMYYLHKAEPKGDSMIALQHGSRRSFAPTPGPFSSTVNLRTAYTVIQAMQSHRQEIEFSDISGESLRMVFS